MSAPTSIHSRRLLAWYGRNRRDLPWRRTGDPYAVWISEIMLQQTVVKTVIPYFDRWMKAFPDIKTLARADRDAVMRLWQGLGYYSRAIALQDAARTIIEDLNGEFPQDEEGLRRLPGIGPYTAAAIAAIAFGRRTVAVDSLIRRVLYRFLGMRGEASSARGLEFLRREGLVLISKSRPGDSTQALMDLANAVCRPKAPLCKECPLNTACKAFLAGSSGRLPARVRSERVSIEAAVGIWLDGGKAFLQKRPAKGLFAGLWELPGGKVEKGETPEEAVVREFREEVGVNVIVKSKLPIVRYAYTKFNVTLHPFIVRGRGGARVAGGNRRFVPLEEIVKYPQPAANGKIWKLFENFRK